MRFIFLLALIALAACKPPATPSVQSNILNIDSLLSAQAKLLSTVSIEKTLMVGDSTFQRQTLQVNLEKELELFKEIGQINRPIYQRAYHTSIKPDTQSNLTIKEFQAVEDVPVKTIRLYYLNEPTQLKRLEATVATEDLYQSSEKKLILDFSILGDTVRLKSYGVSGDQQYFLGAPQYFSMSTTIL